MRLPPRRAAFDSVVFAATRFATSPTVVSDGLWWLRATTLVRADHTHMVTDVGKAYVAVKILLAVLKTAITDTCHAFGFAEYVHRHLAEFQYRFNRPFNRKTVLPRVLTAHGAPPSPERLLRPADVSR